MSRNTLPARGVSRFFFCLVGLGVLGSGSAKPMKGGLSKLVSSAAVRRLFHRKEMTVCRFHQSNSALVFRKSMSPVGRAGMSISRPVSTASAFMHDKRKFQGR